MAVTRERFNQGMTYEQFKASMTRNRDRLESNQGGVQLNPADVSAIKNLPKPIDVLVLGADWCYDVLTNLPVLAQLAEATGRLNLRIFERDQNPDVMSQYLNGEYQSIPVFAFFDAEFNELGRWVERPRIVTELRARGREEIYQQNPSFGSPHAPVDQLPQETRTRLQQAMNAMREETMPRANQEVVNDIRAIIEGRTRVGGSLATSSAKS